MKATFYLLTIIFFSICFVACEKDNLDIAPNATFGGEIRDMETGELVEQEIIRGSQIYFIELGWDNPPVQAMAVKNDGTFQNNLMFAGDYKIIGFRLEHRNRRLDSMFIQCFVCKVLATLWQTMLTLNGCACIIKS